MKTIALILGLAFTALAQIDSGITFGAPVEKEKKEKQQ